MPTTHFTGRAAGPQEYPPVDERFAVLEAWRRTVLEDPTRTLRELLAAWELTVLLLEARGELLWAAEALARCRELEPAAACNHWLRRVA